MIAARSVPLFGVEPLPGGGAHFRLPATPDRRPHLIVGCGAGERRVALDEGTRAGARYLGATVDAVPHGTRYAYAFDGDPRRYPDPASRWQPDGVHAPSAVWSAPYAWAEDGWTGRPWHEHAIYELHVGTFSPEGTYAGVAARLAALVDLGVTAIELMPVAAFPGARGWGYDGVFWYAPHAGYGTPDDLKGLVEAAHRAGLAVFLDVVYNHFGPEGNYLHALAPSFFEERETTPWGAALAYGDDAVRAFAIDNARYWVEEFRFDGLRLDAVQEIRDRRRPSILHDIRAGIAEVALRTGRRIHAVVENDANVAAVLRDDGFDAQWNDDVHHALHVLATGETDGYYVDYAHDTEALLGRALTSGYAYQGDPSRHRGGAPRGTPSGDLPPLRFIDFLQNHDQIGNRALGERIAALARPEALRVVTAIVLLAPQPPLLFMGEEWAASTPFLFFCDVAPDLAAAVRAGRAREFAAFARFSDPRVQATIPDATDPATFARCRLAWDERDAGAHARTLSLYRELLAIRARAIAPLVDGVAGARAVPGPRALDVAWSIADGRELALEARFGAAADGAAFAALAPDVHVLFATPPGAWSVRWSIAPAR